MVQVQWGGGVKFLSPPPLIILQRLTLWLRSEFDVHFVDRIYDVLPAPSTYIRATCC